MVFGIQTNPASALPVWKSPCNNHADRPEPIGIGKVSPFETTESGIAQLLGNLVKNVLHESSDSTEYRTKKEFKRSATHAGPLRESS